MKPPPNHFFVKVDSEYNDRIETKNGTKLFLTTERFTVDDDKTNAAYKPTMLRRHYGTVVAAPEQLTEAEKVIDIDPGLPYPKRYTLEWKTCADFELDGRVGDKIYFHHNTIIEDNLVAYIGERIYKLPYHHAMCIVRNGEITPIAGNVLVEPRWEDGVEDLGNGARGKLSQSGLVTELHDKPKHLEGIVRYVSSPMKGENIGLKPGDIIIYIENADWEIEIEGKKYYVMKYWDILAKIEEPEEQLEIPSPSGFIPNI